MGPATRVPRGRRRLGGEYERAGLAGVPRRRGRIGHGNWSLGTAFFYQDLCFIQQDEGGDEWLTIRHGIAFESIRRAFELYATGEYSVRQLYQLLTKEGLLLPATAKRPARPLALSKFFTLLRNRYYIGRVTYRGIEYQGKHKALIEPDLFERVQQILDERDQHSLKHRVHIHYLRGLLTCRRCRGRLMYTLVRGKGGGEFAYYACGNRHHREHGCDLPYLPAGDIEDRR